MGNVSGRYDRKARSRSWDELIGELAGRQHGVVALRQLLALGLSRAAVEARVKRGRLIALHRGVYAVGHTALTYKARLLAAVCPYGPDAAASHRAAGGLHGLVDRGWVEVTTIGRRRSREGVALHRAPVLGEADRATVDAIPTTSVARTLVDLADVLSEVRLAKVVQESEILRVFDLRSLREAQQRAGLGRRGKHRLDRVLTAYETEPHCLRSEAERKFKRLCERHGIKRPLFNAVIEGMELDTYWPDRRLAVEIDGAASHDTRRAFHEDRRRDRALARAGVQVIRVTWADLGDGLADELREILARR